MGIMPIQKPGRSRQDYATPNNFIEAVIKKFGKIDFDLAANQTNAKAERFYSEGDNSLNQDWTKLEGNLWLNPPYSDISPWAEKCKNSMGNGKKILFLVPASVGSNWYFDYVFGFGTVYFIAPRLSFDGKNSYPKDCMLVNYDGENAGFEKWRWK